MSGYQVVDQSPSTLRVNGRLVHDFVTRRESDNLCIRIMLHAIFSQQMFLMWSTIRFLGSFGNMQTIRCNISWIHNIFTCYFNSCRCFCYSGNWSPRNISMLEFLMPGLNACFVLTFYFPLRYLRYLSSIAMMRFCNAALPNAQIQSYVIIHQEQVTKTHTNKTGRGWKQSDNVLFLSAWSCAVKYHTKYHKAC